MSRRTYAIAAIMLAIIIFLGINIAADSFLTSWRIDLTENGQFTLAQGSRNIIARLKEPITLRFFFSKRIAADYAQTNAYAQRVRDLLREIARRSQGNIVLEEIDPEPFTPEEDEAGADGLSAAPTDTGEQVYFGLVGTNRIDGKETIPYFSPDREPFLEYDIISLIDRLTNPKKPEVGILSSLPLATGPGGLAAQLQGQAQPNAIYQELNQAFAPQMIDPGFKRLPSGLDVLMIVHPAGLSNVQLYAIDQFVLAGGHALVFVDPNSEMVQAAGDGEMGQQGAAPPSSDLPALFRAWGIRYDPNKVVADRARAQRVQVSSDPRNPVADYPIWLHLTKDDFNQRDPVSANLQTLNLASAGALRATPNTATKFTPLVSSSDEANLLDAAQVRFVPRPQDLLSEVLPTGEHYTIAARITGPAKTAFPAGPPIDTSAPEAGASTSSPQQIRDSHGAVNLIVMADSDIFDDRFWVRVENLFGNRIAAPFADNAAFVLNAVENLTGSSDLISLRTRVANDRPFTVVRELQAQAQARYQQEADTLQQRLTATQQQLHDVEQGGSTNGRPTTSTVLTLQQQAAIERFKRQLVQTRTELRDVQHNLRKDIDTLGDILAFINILLIPLVLVIVALVVASLRRRGRERAVTAGSHG